MAAGDIIIPDNTLTPEILDRIAAEVNNRLQTSAKDPGQWETVTSLAGVTSLPVFCQTGTAYKLVRVAVSVLQGANGREVELQVNADKTLLQWRYVGVSGSDLQPTEWHTLIDIALLKGAPGDTPEFRYETSGLEWKYLTETEWKTLIPLEDLVFGWEDMTDEAIADLWRKLPADVLAEMQAPATEAAEEVRSDMDKIQTEYATLSGQITTAEQARATAETTRQQQEAKRQSDTATAITDAEAATAAANKAKQDAEAATAAANKAKQDADTATGLATTAAQNADTSRLAIEKNEQDRQTAETTRQQQEAKRQTDTASAISTMQTATGNAITTMETATDTAVGNAEEATTAAIQAKEQTEAATDLATELNNHPMKIQGGVWYKWNPETDAYENTGIQAKGDPGASFRIIGQFDTAEELKAAVPDGTEVDGVYAIGATDPFDYYAWCYADGAWQWVNQGQLRGPEGKSAYEVWVSDPDNADKTLADWYAYLRQPATDAAADAREAITDAETATATANTAAQNADTARLAIEKNEQDRQTAETTRQQQEAKRQSDTATAISNTETATQGATAAEQKALSAANTALNASASLIIPDIDHEPTEEDLTYVHNEITYQYKIGGLCRMADPDTEEGYTFFRLYDITAEGKAVWGGAGSGGSGSGDPAMAMRIILDRSRQTGQISLSNKAGYYLIEEKLRRVMGAVGQDGGMKVCPLDKGNSTLSATYGLPMAVDGSEGDMFLLLPDLYIKQETLSETQQSFLVMADKPNRKGWTHIPASLVGVKKGHVLNGKLRSISGVVPTTDLTQEQFVEAARAQGEGYGLISYLQHCVVAMLLYAKYETLDIQSVVGQSKATPLDNNLTGSSDLAGMTDTTPSSVTRYVNALGIEGIYGGYYEFMQGLTLTGTTWHVKEADGTVRDIEASNLSTGWISHTALETGTAFDLVPTACTGTSSTFYYDYCEVALSKYIPLVVARSGFTGSENNDDCGVSYLNATHRASEPGALYSSRLAYHGAFEVVDDPEVYKQMITITTP